MHLLLLLRLKLTPLKRGRKGHPKKIPSQNRSLSLSRSLRPTGRRGKPSPSMVTTRFLLPLSLFHLLLSTLLLLRLQPLSTSLILLPSSSMSLFSQLHLYSLPLSIMFLPTLSLSLSPQPFPLYLHLNLSLPLNLSLLQHLNRLHLLPNPLPLPQSP